MLCWMSGQLAKLERGEKTEEIFRWQNWVEFGDEGHVVGETWGRG